MNPEVRFLKAIQNSPNFLIGIITHHTPRQAWLFASERPEYSEYLKIPIALKLDDPRYTVAALAPRPVGGPELNAWLVSEGWALAYRRYSTDYVAEEQAAKEARRGLWRGEFIAPWEWRRGKRL